MIALLALSVAQAGHFTDCLEALQRGEPWARNHTGCAAWAHDQHAGTETKAWSIAIARERLLAVVEPLRADLRRSVEDCPGIGARKRFPMPTLQICNLVAGKRAVTVYDERDLVTAATAPVDLGVLRHTSPVTLELGPEPTVIEHTYAAGMARYRVQLRSPTERVCLTARDRFVVQVERLTLREEGEVRIWELDLGYLACMPSRDADEAAGETSCACSGE